MKIAVVGGGVFGLTAALELAARGHAVTLVERDAIPAPLAESTDISKVVRMDYGADVEYTALGERALAGWRAWNARWPRPLFHETGVTFLSRAPMAPGGFEHDSFALLTSRGHPIERLDAHAIARRFPAYRPGALADGYFNPRGGWAESGAVVAQLGADARAAGITVRENTAVIALDDLAADLVVACAGSWAAQLVPALAGVVRPIGQPVFHLRPDDPALFAAACFPVFGADIARTGYYGFPANADGIVKIANHGAGTPVTSDTDRVVSAAQEAHVRAFLADTFPALAAAPIVHTRLCVYGDTHDGHFLIARHPMDPRVVVATGGSGHAFKFAPVLGAMIADVALGGDPGRYGWRGAGELTRGDAARASPDATPR